MSDDLGSSLHSVIRRWLFNNIYSNDNNSKVKETDLFTHNSSGSLSALQILTRLIHLNNLTTGITVLLFLIQL